MLPGLTELLFVEVLRKHMRCLSADWVGRFAALDDPVARADLKCLHAKPLHDWAVDCPVRQAGVSRTVLV